MARRALWCGRATRTCCACWWARRARRTAPQPWLNASAKILLRKLPASSYELISERIMTCPVTDSAHFMVGFSSKIGAVRRLIDKASRNRLPVLLLGESGSGKEVVARAIHDANPRGQFVPIDCGSLVGTLMESELFGHVKGSFSGAVDNKRGLVELADGGTAFFDEIGDLPLEMQVKLLRLIQEGEFRAVGALHWRKVDLRLSLLHI